MPPKELETAIVELGRDFEEYKRNLNQKVDAETKAREELHAALNRINSGAVGTSVSTGKVGSLILQDRAGNKIRACRKGESLAATAGTYNQDGVTVGDLVHAKITGCGAQELITKNYMSTETGPGGGFVVQPVIANDIFDLARARSVLAAAGAAFIGMPSADYRICKVASDPTVSATREGAEITASDVSFAAVNMYAKKYAALTTFTRELFEDAPNAIAAINDVLVKAAANAMDYAGLNGAGSPGAVTGLCVDSSIPTVASAVACDFDAFLDAIGAVEHANEMPVTAVMPPAVKKTLAKLRAVEDGQYLRAPEDYAALQKLVTGNMAVNLALVGDFSKLLFGIRTDVTIDMGLATDDFKHDRISLRMVFRIDAVAIRPAAFYKLQFN